MKAILTNFLYIIPNIFSNIYFNFHYLPIKQAILLPIWLYKPKFGILSGRIIICNRRIRPGMIKLGFNQVALYPNSGISIQNAGGDIIFYGNCSVGNNSYIAVGKQGKLEIGDNFLATSSLKIACQYRVKINDNVLMGWEATLVDSDFHKLSFVEKTNNSYVPFGKIEIGEGCWLAFKATIMKNVNIPNYCVIASNSLVNRNDGFDEFCLIAGTPARVVKTGVYRDSLNDTICYEYN